MVANKQELEEANKQQFRKERDNKGGTRRSMAIFALNTLTHWQQLRETVGNVSAEGIRPFLYCLALVCDKRMTFLKIVKVCHRPVSKRSRVRSRGPLTFFVYHSIDTIVVIKIYWSLVLNDTWVLSKFDSFNNRFNIALLKIQFKTLFNSKENSGKEKLWWFTSIKYSFH